MKFSFLSAVLQILYKTKQHNLQNVSWKYLFCYFIGQRMYQPIHLFNANYQLWDLRGYATSTSDLYNIFKTLDNFWNTHFRTRHFIFTKDLLYIRKIKIIL